MPLDQLSCIKMYKNNAGSSLFCRLVIRSIDDKSDGLEYLRFTSLSSLVQQHSDTSISSKTLAESHDV